MKLLEELFPKRICRDELSSPAAKESRQQYFRLDGRLPMRYRVTLTFQDPKGRSRSVTAKAIDMSGAGTLMETSNPIDVGTLVYVRCSENSLIAGGAYVRHCTRRGWKYRIGLEFHTPVRQRF